jgi:hypothetical protein
MKKVFQVLVDIEMYVYAENEEEAEKLAKKHYRDEWDFSAHATMALKPGARTRLPKDILVSIPWGQPDDLTIEEVLATQPESK